MFKNILLLICLTLAGVALFYLIDFWVKDEGTDLFFTQQITEPDAYRAEFQDANDTRTHLFIKTCVQCHDVPDPKAHTASEWPPLVSEMVRLLKETRQAKPEARSWFIPGPTETEKIVAYLVERAGKDK